MIIQSLQEKQKCQFVPDKEFVLIRWCLTEINIRRKIRVWQDKRIRQQRYRRYRVEKSSTMGCFVVQWRSRGCDCWMTSRSRCVKVHQAKGRHCRERERVEHEGGVRSDFSDRDVNGLTWKMNDAAEGWMDLEVKTAGEREFMRIVSTQQWERFSWCSSFSSPFTQQTAASVWLLWGHFLCFDLQWKVSPQSYKHGTVLWKYEAFPQQAHIGNALHYTGMWKRQLYILYNGWF